MGYRRLVKQYMKHVQWQSGQVWLQGGHFEHLSPRDVDELQAIYADINREAELATQGTFNQRAVAIVKALELSSGDLAEKLGWKEDVVAQWLLPENHPNHRPMSQRDLEHLMSSLKIDENGYFLPDQTSQYKQQM